MVQNNSLTIQALSIIGGILTAIFLLGFMFVSSMIDTELSAMITGVILIVATLLINRSSTASFLDAMNITLYVAGVFLLGYGLFQNLVLLFIILMIISVLTFLFSKGFILPFLSVILFAFAFLGEIAQLTFSWELLEIGMILILAAFLLTNIYETKVSPVFKNHLVKYRPFHAGLFVSCIALLAILSIRSWIIDIGFFWVSSVAIWIGILITVRKIMEVMEIKSIAKQTGVYALCLIICLPTLFAPYLSGSLLLILICFHYGYRTECAFALLLFIYAISKYYYDLNLNLLLKSITLFFTGIALLVAWYYFTQKKTKHEKI